MFRYDIVPVTNIDKNSIADRLVWIERELAARICYVLVLDSSVLHATISRVRAKHPPYGGKLRPCPHVYGLTKLCQNSSAL